MWISKTKYELEKLRLEQRIEYLENIICPEKAHDYEEVWAKMVSISANGEKTTKHIYKCKRCGNMYSKLTNESGKEVIPQ